MQPYRNGTVIAVSNTVTFTLPCRMPVDARLAIDETDAFIYADEETN